MTSTMTRDQAQALRIARDTDAKLLSRKPKYELVAIYQSEGGYGGGTWSKDELLGAILEMRFPLARQNEAAHVLHHDVTWPDCEWCQNPVCSRCGFPARLDADGRWVHESNADAAFCALVMAPGMDAHYARLADNDR